MSVEPVFRFTATKHSGGNGIKRPRSASGNDDATIPRYRPGDRSVNARHLNITSEILADIGLTPLDLDDDDLADAENDVPIYGVSKTSSSLDMTVSWAAEPLGPTLPNNFNSNSVMPLRVIQAENSSAMALPEKSNFKLKKRPRLESPVSVERDMFREFSDEVFLQIFQWLPKSTLKHCAQVCRRWRRLSYDESLWKFLDLGGRKLGLATLEHILQRGVIVMRLAKADIYAPVNPHVYSRERVFKVQYLDLSMMAISIQALETLLSGCKSLLKLSLESCVLNVKVCQYIGQNKNLMELNLALCSGIDTMGLQAILSGCEKIEALNLAWTSLTNDCVHYAVNHFPKSLIRLDLSGCRGTISNKEVSQLAASCLDLEVLNLSDAIQLSSVSLAVIKTKLTKLKSLHLSRCYNINPESYRTVVEMPALTELSVFGVITPPGVEMLKTSLGNVAFNVEPLSTIARPTTGIRRTSIWTLRVRE